MSRRGSRPAVTVTALAVLLSLSLDGAGARAASDGAAVAAPWKGLPLRVALERLEAAGLSLLYSSAVVRPSMKVTVEPLATEARALLEEILAPLGLKSAEGPAGAVLILGAGEDAGWGDLRGRVVAAATGAAVPGARVLLPGSDLSQVTRPDGTFAIPRVPPGVHEVRVSAPGFIETVAPAVRIGPGGSADLLIRLEAGPTLVEAIVVTPIRHELAAPELSLGRAIDREDVLLAPAIGGDVSRVVALLPGITGADNSAAFNARGAQSRDVSLVLDGLELYEPFHLESLQSPFSLIDSRNIDRIEFLGGGFTADLGDRHGGFVELSTSLPGQDPATHVEVGTINSRISWSAPTPVGSILVSARAWYPEAMRNTIEVGEEGLAPRFGDAYVKATFHAGPATVLSAHGLVAYDRLRFSQPGEIDAIDLDNTGVHAWIRGVHSWSDSVLSDTVLSTGRIDSVKEGQSDPNDGPTQVQDDRTFDFFGLQHDMSWQITGSHMLRGGLQAKPLRASYDYEEITAAGTETRRLSPSGTAWSAYLAHRAALSEVLTMEAGVRFDRQSHTADSQFSPRLNALWRAGANTEVRVGLGRYYQSQRINELNIEDGETAFLPAELAEQAALTFQHRFMAGYRFRVDAYTRTISRVHPRYENLFNPIELFPETEEDRVRIAPDESRLRGFELLLQGAEGRALHWWAAWAVSNAEDTIDGDEAPRSWDQTHAGKFLVGYRGKDRWSLALSGTAHSGWPTTPVTGVVVNDPSGGTSIEPVLGSRNEDRLPAYLRFDLKLTRSFTLPRGILRANLDLLNLTDRKNVCCVDEFVFEPLSNGDVETDRVDDYWLGLTGTFSLLYEF